MAKNETADNLLEELEAREDYKALVDDAAGHDSREELDLLIDVTLFQAFLRDPKRFIPGFRPINENEASKLDVGEPKHIIRHLNSLRDAPRDGHTSELRTFIIRGYRRVLLELL